MPALKNDKFKDYTRYAECCLNMVASTRDQELRCIRVRVIHRTVAHPFGLPLANFPHQEQQWETPLSPSATNTTVVDFAPLAFTCGCSPAARDAEHFVDARVVVSIVVDASRHESPQPLLSNKPSNTAAGSR